MTGERAERRRGMLHGRRKGPRLSPHKQNLLDHLLPLFELRLIPNVDPRIYFRPDPCEEAETRGVSGGGHIEDIWLEVGFGGGEHLAWQAQHHPSIGFIGADPYVNGVVKLLSQLEDVPAANIRIYSGDARDILRALPDASLGRTFILFPDPWPKMRHHKRRFIQMDTLDELARVMKPGAELRFASDDAGYVEWTLERRMAHPAFVWTATQASDWRTRSTDWPPTRYEAKQLHGKPVFLRFRRT